MKNIPNLNIDDVDDEENLVQKKFTKSIKSKQNNKSTSHEDINSTARSQFNDLISRNSLSKQVLKPTRNKSFFNVENGEPLFGFSKTINNKSSRIRSSLSDAKSITSNKSASFDPQKELIKQQVEAYLREKEKDKENLFSNFIRLKSSDQKREEKKSSYEVDPIYFFDSKRTRVPVDSAANSRIGSALSVSSTMSERTNLGDVLENLKSCRLNSSRRHQASTNQLEVMSDSLLRNGEKSNRHSSSMSTTSSTEAAKRNEELVEMPNKKKNNLGFYSNSWRIHSELCKDRESNDQRNKRIYDSQGNNKSTFFVFCTRDKQPETFLFDPNWI